jgi:Tol biopolymer transport system component
MGRVALHSRLSVVLGAAIAVAACSQGPVGPSLVPSSPPPPASNTEPSASVTASAAPVVGASEPWIAFEQFLGKATVMLVRPDGSDLHSPTIGVPGGDQTNPDWSPDGSQLVLAVRDGGSEKLWVVNADSTDARLLADCQGDCVYLDDPDWSPDGRTVLFSRMRTVDGNAVGTLEQVDVASGASEVLVEAEPGHFYAGQRWSPDGMSVVLEVVTLAGPSVDADVEDVSLAIIDMAVPTPAGRELIGSRRFPETAAWASDGSVIVFAALDAPAGGALDLFAIAPDGSGVRRITTLGEGGGTATHPDVTEDGSSVVFAATRPGEDGSVLAKVDIDGGDVTPAAGSEFIAGVHPRLRPVP